MIHSAPYINGKATTCVLVSMYEFSIFPKRFKAFLWAKKKTHLELKADQPHSRGYPHTPPGYRHTDKTLGPVMTTLYSKFEGNCILPHSASRAVNIDQDTPDIWPCPRPLTSKQGQRQLTDSDVKIEQLTVIDLWPMTLTYNPKIKVKQFKY